MLWVLVVFTPETDEVQVRGPWHSELEANGAARAYSRGLVDTVDNSTRRFAVVGVTPLAYYDPDVHK